MASFHPTGVTLEIVGLESNTQGRSCDMHATCGCLVKEDVVLRLRKVQVVVEGMEESAIAAYHVSESILVECILSSIQSDTKVRWFR